MSEISLMRVEASIFHGDSYGLIHDENNPPLKYIIRCTAGQQRRKPPSPAATFLVQYVVVLYRKKKKTETLYQVRFSLRHAKCLELTAMGVGHHPECSAGETKEIVLPRLNDSDCR